MNQKNEKSCSFQPTVHDMPLLVVQNIQSDLCNARNWILEKKIAYYRGLTVFHYNNIYLNY